MTQSEQVAVEQRDRSEAWPFRPSCYQAEDAEKWLSGLYDSTPVIQAFASHRTRAIEATQAAEIARMQEALMRISSGRSSVTECSTIARAALTTPTRIEASQAGAGDGLREALGKCRDRFEEYVTSHYEKGTPDGNAKAVRNAEMVELCEKALATPPIQASQPQEAVDVALLDRAELAWQRSFYPSADCFADDGEKHVFVDLELADCLRLVLAAIGREVRTPVGCVSPPQAAESGLLDEAIAALRVARMWSDDDWVGREIVDKVLAKAGKPGEAGNG